MLQKLMILPLLVVFTFVGIYKEADVIEEPILEHNTTLPLEEQALGNEIINVYNTNNDEMNDTNTTSISEEKAFSLEIVGELNTTKETAVSISVKLINAKNSDSCTYLWSENNELIAMGATLDEAFSKGEHKVFLRVINGSTEEEINASIVINAYDYYVEETLHFNAYYGELEYAEKEVRNHRGHNIFSDDGYFMKSTYVYNEEERMTEETVDYYRYPSEYKKVRYQYDSRGNRIRIITLNRDDIVMYIVENQYDDEGMIVKTLSGEDEDSLVEANYGTLYNNEDVYESPYAERESMTRLNDHGDIVYEEVFYGSMKLVYEYEYDDEFKITKEISTMNSPRRFQERTNYYNKEGMVKYYERKYGKSISEVQCSYMTKYSYNKEGRRESVENEIYEGECSFLDDVKKTYKYDKDGLLKSIESSMDGVKGYSTMKVIKTYTNDFEM
jgi:hypothetical protein